MNNIVLELNPSPNSHCLRFRGDTLYFTLKMTPVIPGTRAFLHTNLGYVSIQRREILKETEDHTAITSQDWHDIAMPETDEPGVFRIRMAMNEIGHFEASVCIITESGADPIWVDGGQIHLNVEPAGYCCSNSIYCAFVRQFGNNKNQAVSTVSEPQQISTAVLDQSDYTVIPPSGTFRDLIKELDFIFNRLQCRILHLLPINPVPTTYARMGRFGSPYAALDFTAIDPAYAVFDRKATPLDQFLELVDAVHFRGGKLFIDLAINHTGWAAKIHETHPEWLVREADGTIHSPGAWGVTWGDLTELNYKNHDLWKEMAEVFLTWCKRGVDGFRCDAGYMIPFPAWQYIIARVRLSYPEAIFLLEGLGGAPAITLSLLNKANMNWAYSELFQNYSREAIEGYINYSTKVSTEDGLMVHYAETHDNARLAATSETWSKMRTGLSALTSANGAFGFTNGVEWFAKEKVDVHMDSALNWGAKSNQVDYIRQLNTILMKHPAFHPGGNSRFVESHTQDGILYFRTDRNNAHPLLICVNINCQKPTVISWKESNIPFKQGTFTDLISGQKITPLTVTGHGLAHTLQPGEVLCLAENSILVDDPAGSTGPGSNQRILTQQLRAQILDILCWRRNTNVIPEDANMFELAQKLYTDPAAFLKNLYHDNELPSIIRWSWPEDITREVMIPPNHLLFVTLPAPFTAGLIDENGLIHRQRSSVKAADGSQFVVFVPLPTPGKHQKMSLRLYTTVNGRSERRDGPLLQLAGNVVTSKIFFNNDDIRFSKERTCLLTNGKGAMIRPAVEWGALWDRYNALLAVNFSPDYPEDRHIMFRRLRIKVQHHARIEEIRLDLTKNFSINARREPVWNFSVPIGKGILIQLQVVISAVPNQNAVRIAVSRPAEYDADHNIIQEPDVRVLLFPDLEDRHFHNETKAYAGPEREWPNALTTASNETEMIFAPAADRILRIAADRGRFIRKEHWFYNVYQPKEAARGLEPSTDIWSPGFFEVKLGLNEKTILRADVFRTRQDLSYVPPDFTLPPLSEYEAVLKENGATERDRIDVQLRASMTQFIVSRNAWKTVIAGYPWFLDWGRDTLICTRGLMTAGFHKEVRDIILQFAKFTENGTMPNIIHGNVVGNRDTSDATLWLYVAVNDYLKITNDRTILDEMPSPGKTLTQILVDTVEWHLKGTPNGIRVDLESNLVFSPAHFTWMDTNYPAGTRRQGYPIEIQALWYAAQLTLSQLTGEIKFTEGAEKTLQSVIRYFILPNDALSDCLNAEFFIPASAAIQTDHLRPNQLLAVTLGMITDPKNCRAIIRETSNLLIPGGIRSLADEPVRVPIPVEWHGRLLNDPYKPYWGNYEGDEDTRRKPAYHNGTAWTWIFPSFSEALVMTYRESAIPTARAILSSIQSQMESGCIGHISEILDGNYPHTPRGCDAQSWGATEVFRVWNLIQNMKK